MIECVLRVVMVTSTVLV